MIKDIVILTKVFISSIIRLMPYLVTAFIPSVILTRICINGWNINSDLRNKKRPLRNGNSFKKEVNTK